MKRNIYCILLFVFSSFTLFGDGRVYDDYWNTGYSGYADIEYIGKCSKYDWDSGNYDQIARRYFPRETIEKLTDKSATNSFLLLITLTGRSPTPEETRRAESLTKIIERHTYWTNISKIDKRTEWLLQEALQEYNFSEGEIYKIIVNYSFGFIVRISSGNNKSYTYSYYSFEKTEKDINL